MSEIKEPGAENSADSAEKAYAAAAEVAAKPDVTAVADPQPAQLQIKPAAIAKPAVAGTGRQSAVAKAKAPKPAKSPAPAKPARATPRKPAAVRKPVASSQLKENTMSKNAKIAKGIKEVVADAQAKAKMAVEKGSSLMGEAGEFTKGNVEAVVASGKILAAGLQTMGKEIVADGRTAFETVTGEVKQIAAIKSPTELLKVQGEIARKNLDTAIALSSKNGEAVLKLAGDVFAPISGRFSLAAEKLRKLAA